MEKLSNTISRQNLTGILNGLSATAGITIVFTDMQGNRYTSEMQNSEPADAKPESSCLLRKVAVMCKGEKVGTICSSAKEGSEALLKMAAYCLENSWRLEMEIEDLSSEIVSVYEELSLIYSLSEKLGSALDIGNICQQVLDEISRTIAVKTIIIMLLDEKSGMLEGQFCTGLDRNRLDRIRADASAEPFAGIFAMKRATVVPESAIGSPLPFPLPAALCVPLVTDNKNIGMLIARDKISGEEFRSREIKLVDALSGEIAATIKKAQLYERINKLFINTVEALASAIDAKDPYTYGHSRRVARISASISRELGMSSEAIHSLKLAALLHDIGKIGTPELILKKPGRLLTEETEIIREHPVQGAQILSAIEELKDVTDWIKHHHERYDGKGYPDRYKADEIPLQSRIISIADSFDAMTSDRPYRKGMDPVKVVDIMEDLAGIQYDPDMFRAFKAVFMQKKDEVCLTGVHTGKEVS